MLSKQPETYNELIRAKSCYRLADYFRLTEEQINHIYEFLSQNQDNHLSSTKDMITLYRYGAIAENIPVRPATDAFDSVSINNNQIQVLSPYANDNFSSNSGSSSNNNNNNNNNNG